MCLFSWRLHALPLDNDTIRLLQLSLLHAHSWLGLIVRILKKNGAATVPCGAIAPHCDLGSFLSGLASVDLTSGNRRSTPACCSLMAYVHHCDFKATADCFVDASSEHGPMVLVYTLSDRNVVRPRHVPSTVDILDDRARPALSVVMLAGSLRSWYMNLNTLCVSCGLLVSRG